MKPSAMVPKNAVTQGRDAQSRGPAESDQTRAGQLHAARNTNQHARVAGRRAHKIGKNRRNERGLILNQNQGAATPRIPGTAIVPAQTALLQGFKRPRIHSCK